MKRRPRVAALLRSAAEDSHNTEGAGSWRRLGFALCLCVSLAACSSTQPAHVSALREQAQKAQIAGFTDYQRAAWSSSARSFERAASVYAALEDFASEATARHNQARAL